MRVKRAFLLCIHFSWLREKHSIPDAINHLFTQALNQRLQKFCINPIYRSDNKVQILSPSESFVSASHLFQGLSTSANVFSVPISPIAENADGTDNGEAKMIPVDIFVKNTYFGQKPRPLGKVHAYLRRYIGVYAYVCNILKMFYRLILWLLMRTLGKEFQIMMQSKSYPSRFPLPCKLKIFTIANLYS